MAVPTAAGPPIPYWPSVVVKPDTVRGVGMYYVNLILDVIFGVFALTIGLSAVFVAFAADPFAAIVVVGALSAASCGLVIVFIINFIISLMSVFRMHHGANEYGPEHARHARRGILFKWVGTSLSTLAAILVVYLLVIGSSALFFGTSLPPTVFVPLLITGFWTAGVSAKAQMYRYMVRSLQDPDTVRWSDLASAVIPVLGLVGVVVVGYFTLRVIDLVTNPGGVSPQDAGRFVQVMVGGVFLPPGLALVGYLIFLAIYGRTKERLTQGLARVYQAVPPPMAWTGWPPNSPGPASAPAVPGVSASPAEDPTSAPGRPGFCGRCGRPLAASDLFCTNCGQPRG